MLFIIASGVASEKRLFQYYIPHSTTAPVLARSHNGSDYSSGWSAWYKLTVGLNSTDITTALGYTPVNKAGDTISTSGANLKWGNITLYGGGSNGGINSMLIGDDVTIGDCNVGGCFGMKSTGANAGFGFYNSSGTSIGGIQSTAGTLQWINSSGTATNISLDGHTHSYAGSASAGGSATSAVKLDTATAGSATQPCYFTGGKPSACTYSLNATVPSGAVFTDTKNTAGSTDTSSKIFLIGATSQAANPQTYSDNEVFATSGVLTTKSVQVGGGSATMQYNSSLACIDFVFA